MDGLRHGYGTLRFTDSPVVYEGQWWQGKRHGRGVLYYSAEQTASYEGEWLAVEQAALLFQQEHEEVVSLWLEQGCVADAVGSLLQEPNHVKAAKGQSWQAG